MNCYCFALYENVFYRKRSLISVVACDTSNPAQKRKNASNPYRLLFFPSPPHRSIVWHLWRFFCRFHFELTAGGINILCRCKFYITPGNVNETATARKYFRPFRPAFLGREKKKNIYIEYRTVCWYCLYGVAAGGINPVICIIQNARTHAQRINGLDIMA